MPSNIIQVGSFKGIKQQPLRNVWVYSPSIVWIQNGSKQLLWQDNTLTFESCHWLILPANQYLSFVNIPEDQHFFSKMLTLIEPPPSEWLSETSDLQYSSAPRIQPSQTLKYGFNQLYAMEGLGLSEGAQKHLLYSFYAELKAQNLLSRLFPSNQSSLKERLSIYFSSNPSLPHNIEATAEHFHMSRSTLIRKLHAEQTHFRTVLAEVRMGYALSLLQQNYKILDAALACGYQSQTRFSARFKQQFGVTPRQYANTLSG